MKSPANWESRIPLRSHFTLYTFTILRFYTRNLNTKGLMHEISWKLVELRAPVRMNYEKCYFVFVLVCNLLKTTTCTLLKELVNFRNSNGNAKRIVASCMTNFSPVEVQNILLFFGWLKAEKTLSLTNFLLLFRHSTRQKKRQRQTSSSTAFIISKSFKLILSRFPVSSSRLALRCLPTFEPLLNTCIISLDFIFRSQR